MKPEDLQARLDRDAPTTMLGALGKSFFWGPVLLGTQLRAPAVLLQLLNIRKFRGAAFTGEPGNGRHTTACALIASTLNPKFHDSPDHYLKLTGQDLDCEQVHQVYDLIDAVVQIARECTSLCLLLDSPELSRHSQQMQHYLVQCMQQEPALSFVVVISQKAEMIDSELLRMLRHCPCPPPSQAQREEWLADVLNAPVPIFVDEMEIDDLVRETEHFSWGQMQDLLSAFQLLLGKKYYFEIFKKNRDTQALEAALKVGELSVSRAEADALLHSIQAQNPPPLEQRSVIISAGSPGAEQQSSPSSQTGKFDIDSAQEFVKLHGNPKEMTAEQLLNI